MEDNDFDVGSALVGAAVASALSEDSKTSEAAPQVETIKIDNVDNSNPRARESYLNAFNANRPSGPSNITLQDVKSVIETIAQQSAATSKPTTYSEAVVQSMSKRLNAILELRENDQDTTAAIEFKELQKSRSSLLASSTLKEPQNADAHSFVKKMIVQGNDGASASGVEATYQLHKFVKENPDASPEEFAKKLQQSQSISTTTTIEREYPPVVEQDRSQYIQEAKAARLRQEGVFIAEQAVKPYTPKKLVDPSAPPVLSAEAEKKAQSFADTIDPLSKFSIAETGTTTFNTMSTPVSDPFKISKDTAAKADEILAKSSTKFVLEGDEPT